MDHKTIIKIRDWNQHFETAESRKRTGALSWVSMPTKLDGRRFRRLSQRPNAHEIMGAFLLIVEVAARCPERGVLVDDRGDPIGAQDLSDMTGFPVEGFEIAIEVLSDPKINWLEVCEDLPDSAGVCRDVPDTAGSSHYITDNTKQTDRQTRGASSSSKKSSGGDGEIVAALRSAGLRSKAAISRCSKIDGISVVRVQRVAASAASRCRSGSDKAGLIARMLEDRDWDPPPIRNAKEAVQAFKSGAWFECNGIDFRKGKVGWNDDGLCLDGGLVIPAEHLKSAVFQ